GGRIVRVRALARLAGGPLPSRCRVLQRQRIHRGDPVLRRPGGPPDMTMPKTWEGPEKARFVSQMFSRIAGRYDLMNGLMTFGMHHAWRRVAARQTIAAPDGPALDLATGTGDLALELRRIHAYRPIVGVDFALGMLTVAKQKLERVDAHGRIRLAAADALQLPFTDRTFACVTSAFLLPNLSHLQHRLPPIQPLPPHPPPAP